MIALVTISAGFFKIAAVPFHQWTPDAYEGAPTSITAHMSVAVKAASFAMMMRIFLTHDRCAASSGQLLIGVSADDDGWQHCRYDANNIKRLLAYSSISHAVIFCWA
jgi:NADH-quinone oxidoreductase subunit N